MREKTNVQVNQCCFSCKHVLANKHAGELVFQQLTVSSLWKTGILCFLGRGWRRAGTRTSFQAPHHSTTSAPPWRLQSVEEQSASTIAVSVEKRNSRYEHLLNSYTAHTPFREMTMYTVCTFRMSREMIMVRGMSRKHTSSTAMASKARGRWGPVKQGTSPLMNHRCQREHATLVRT